MKIGFGGDHAGFEYKERLIEYLKGEGYEITDFGPHSTESTDYPDYVHPLATAVEKGDVDLGVLICGSGNGVCMTANKHPNVRAALCWVPELGVLARQHNNANVLCLPSRFVDINTARETLDSFLQSEFEGGRHQRRVDKIKL